MTTPRLSPALALVLAGALAGCGSSGSLGSFGLGSLGGGANNREPAVRQATRVRGGDVVAVNRYLWAASLETLSFLPIESVDPFTGVIDFGYGTPPGGGTAYRATVFISDPALDARSLHVALSTRSGPVSAETQRAVEDAILTRARQIRANDRGL